MSSLWTYELLLQFFIEATIGIAPHSDIAIDDVLMKMGKCSSTPKKPNKKVVPPVIPQPKKPDTKRVIHPKPKPPIVTQGIYLHVCIYFKILILIQGFHIA